MSLIHDIQAAAISQTTDLPSLLRMCKLLAARISHKELSEWVDNELNGYSNIKLLPEYRIYGVMSYGTFQGTYRSANKMQVPLSVLPEDMHERYGNVHLGASISAYAAIVADNSTGSVQEPWPLQLALHYASKIAVDMQCVQAWKEIPVGAMVQLLDTVKTRILGFAIDLEKEAPDSGDLPIGSKPPLSREQMTQIYNTNITGNVGNLSNSGENYSQTSTMQINAGDWETLKIRLSELGLAPADFDDIRADVDTARSDGNIDERRSRAGTWVSRLVPKAISAGAGVAVEIAVAGVTKAIASFYGLPGA